MENKFRRTSPQKAQHSLILQLRRRLLLSVALFILCFVLCLVASILFLYNGQQLGTRKVALSNNVNGLLQSMVDQETGLRGYIATDNTIFLQPMTTGRQSYASYFQSTKALTADDSQYQATTAALSEVNDRYNAWSAYANTQLSNMQAGKLNIARSDPLNTQGKNLFDAIRASVTHLQQASDDDLVAIQARTNIVDYGILGGLLFVSIVVAVLLLRTFALYSQALRDSLDSLKEATSAFGEGDLSVRVKANADAEFSEVGTMFNRMAEVLQEQQLALKDRDILEHVLHLNSILTASLDLAPLIERFFQRALKLLDIQIAVLYTYDTGNKSLALFAASGLDTQGMQTRFALGEGLVGRVAAEREPLFVTAVEHGAPKDYQIKTIVGAVLPSSLYHLPLMQNNELLGVLAVGSIYPMRELSRNVLQVIASNLAATIRNTQTYEHIQQQAKELANYAHQQERANHALTQQRDELTVLNSALEEANRVRSQFLSTMSHELRTPLASIIGFSQIIQRSARKSPLSDKQASNLDRILKNAEHLLSLINDVLDLAKIEAGRMDVNAVEVNVKELLTSVVDETRSIAEERGIQLNITVDETLTTIETDPRKVRQIVLNLVSNALKFTEQGSVSVHAASHTRTIREVGKVEQIAITVADTGIGIEPEIQEHIFEAFYQVDNSNSRTYGGTGLGLSIVRELTVLLGGKVEIQSEIGKGSTFTIVLPVHLRDQRFMQDIRLATLEKQGVAEYRLMSGSLAEDLAALHLQSGASDEYLVVAVDDNPDVLQLIASSLEQTPFRVVGVQDSTQAVAVIQELRPQAITLDIMMPKVNGWQILHQLKSSSVTSSIPVILLTVMEDRSAGYVLGADEYLVKPVTRDALLNVLHQLTSSSSPSSAIDEKDMSTIDLGGADTGQSGVDSIPPVQMVSVHGTKPVLFVYHEQNIHQLAERLMHEMGYTVQKGNDEQDLMSIIEKARPDVLMMLVNIEEMT